MTASRSFAAELFGPTSFASTTIAAALHDFRQVVATAALAVALALLGHWLRPRPAFTSTRPRVVVAALVAVAFGALVILGGIVRSGVRSDLLISPDHLAFVALTGILLVRAPLAVRAWSLTILSTAYVVETIGAVAFGVVVGGALCGFVAFTLLRGSPGRITTLVQGGILAAIWAACGWLRATRGIDGFQAYGLFAWMLLRHISFVVHAPRDRPVPLGSYLCFLLFYPSCFGATEMWPEFASRNLSAEPTIDYFGAARWIITGAVCLWAVPRVPTPVDPITGDAAGLVLWAAMLVSFLRSSLALMGIWITLEGVALFYGMCLRPNFHHVLAARRPSQFWRAWRATMTYWLIQYVYIPLGGNRRLQIRNVFAVFAVSTLWHCSSLPMMGMGLGARLAVPIVAWGALNASVIAVEATLRRSPRATEFVAGVPALLRVPIAVLGTAFFGSFTVVLLGFQADSIDRFPGFVSRFFAIWR